MKRTFTKSRNLVIGILTPIKWSPNGEVTHFSIYTTKEEDILIRNQNQFNNLKDLKNKWVQAKGQIRLNSVGDKVIELKSIKKYFKSNKAIKDKAKFNKKNWSDDLVSLPPIVKHNNFSNREYL